MTTSSDLLAPRTQAQLLQDTLTRLEAKPATANARGWGALQLARALVEVDADTRESYEVTRKAVFDGGYVVSAEEDFLDLCATFYEETRNQPLTAIIQLRLTDTVGQGPVSLAAGQIAKATAAGGETIFFRSSVSIDITQSGSVNVPFAAVAPGAKYNVTPGAITTLQTPVPGVGVTSPAIAGQGTIILSAGTDKESDESLRRRCLAKLATLGTGWAKATIESLILDNFPAVTRLLVRDPGGLPGVAEAYLADSAGPVTAQTATDVYNFLKDPTRRPVSNFPVQIFQAGLAAKSLTIQLYSDGSNPNVATDAASRLQAFQAALDLGAQIFESRLKDVIVDIALGALAAHVIDDGTGLPLVDFTPAFNAAVVFTLTFPAPIQV